MEQLTKQMQDVAEKMKSMVPQVTFNKNGYEIRTQVLEIAKDVVHMNYNTRIAQMEIQMEQDKKTGESVTKVTFPPVPGVEQVLEAAQKFYDFVSSGKPVK